MPGSVLFVLSSATPTLPDGKKSGWYWSEVYYPYEEFIKAGYQCEAVSLTGSGAPDEHSIEIVTELMQMEMSAMAAWRNKSHSIHKMLGNLKKPSDITPSNYCIIYFVGGHACLFDLPMAHSIHEIAKNIYERGGLVAAVCHGPAVFQGLKLSDGTLLIKGKRATGFSQQEEEKIGTLDWVRKEKKLIMKEVIERGGGIYSQGDVMKCNVVVDGRVLTGQNPTSAGPLAQKCIELCHHLELPSKILTTTTQQTTPLKTTGEQTMSKTTTTTAPAGTPVGTLTGTTQVKTSPGIPAGAPPAGGQGTQELSIKQQQQMHEYMEQPDFKQ